MNNVKRIICLAAVLCLLLAGASMLAHGEGTVQTSIDLADFLINVTCDAPMDENGNYVIQPGTPYELTFTFAENENLQFDDDATLIYTLPDGLIVGPVGETEFSLTVMDGEGTAIISGNTFEVVDGQLRIRFNQDDPNFARLAATANVRFDISLLSQFDENVGEIVFSPSIIKDFVFDESADLIIDKSVVYDVETDTASYVLTVASSGVNENVVIEDHLTGTALIFNQDVVVESSVNGMLSVTPDYSAVDNGFRVTIPQLANGEVLTLRYSATVDNTKITYNGSAEQTNNTARVTSDQVPDGKEASADFAGQANFQKVSKIAAGDPVQIGENLYEQTWTIRVNDDHKMPMGGAYIYDWIAQNSRPFMQFTGNGITVNVTFENGATEARVIPWSDLFLYTDSNGTIGWRYLAPDTDGNASYEITCKTLINSSNALGNLTLVNGAEAYGTYEEGTVAVGPIGESNFGIRKDAVETTAAESEWRITLTVPGGGLPELHIVDDMPKLEYDGQTYIDYYVPDSMQIDGLLEGESWRLRIGSSERSFTVTFYKTETQNDANKGVLPTPDGQPRDIVIRYKTQVNQDWLNLAAENGYASSTLYRHRNYAAAWSGSYRTETVNASVVPIKPDLVKSFVERAEAEIDGVTYPVFRYSLALFGPLEDGIVIRDVFHTEYLKFYEAEGIRVLGGNNYNPSDGNGMVSAVDTTDGIDITVTSFPKQASGDFYPYYQVNYALIVKDADALDALHEAAALSQSGIDLENTAVWDSLTSSQIVNYPYFPYVDKELLERPSSENGNIAEFKVIINKYAEDLDPTSDTLTILDELSANLRFIPDSLVITPANDAIRVQFDDESNTLIFTDVPDETTFEITYQARVLGQGNVTYSNTIKFGKYEKTIEETTTVTSSGGGTASNPSITLIKRDAEDLSVTLAGATFQLCWMDGDNMVPVLDRNGDHVLFTTGADGSVLLVGNQQALGWALWEGRTYCLVEVEAPTGYEINEEPAYFILSEFPSSQMEYDLVGDQFTVNDTRIKIDLSVTKQWIGPATESVTVELLADDVKVEEAVLNEDNGWQHTFTGLDQYDNGVEIVYGIREPAMENYATDIVNNEDGSYTIINTNIETIDIPVTKQWVGQPAESVMVYLLADGVVISQAELNEAGSWQYTFSGLSKYDGTDGHEITYDVQEVPVPGYDPEYSGTAETGFTFTNTITGKVSIPVTKEWIGPAAESVTVELLADDEKVDEAVLNEENGWQHTFVDLDQYNNGVEIVYGIREPALQNYATDIVSNEDGSFTIINTNTETIDISVTKQWVGPIPEEEIILAAQPLLSRSNTMPMTIQVLLLADGSSTEITLYLYANDYSGVFEGLPKYDPADGHEIRYSVQEINVPEGYQAEVSANPNGGFIITNTNVETLEIPVAKQWIGAPAESVTITLYRDGEVAAEAILSADNGWQYTFTGLPQYDAEDGHALEYTVGELTLEGYESTGPEGSAEDGFTFTNYFVTPMPTDPPATEPPTYPGYDFRFTFTKVWEGDREEGIEWMFYNPDGTVAHKKFNKKIISENEWRYEAWFATGADYFLIETVPEGYQVRYENVGAHAGETDRCYNGGRIVNYKIPKTGDDSQTTLWIILIAAGALGLTTVAASVIRGKKRRK